MSADDHAAIGPGSTVGAYRVRDVLGAGGSGTVYRAQKIDTGVDVALKVMNLEHLDDDSERQRFEREAEVVKRLAHPHVVGLLDYGYDDGLPYLVFPLLDGRTLEQRIAKEGAVGWGLTGKFSAEVLSALEMAHGMGIAHRDIKPANLFLCQGPAGETIQILDFGTAKIVGDKGQRMDVTRAGIMVGTPRYMAPEQVRMETLTPAADVYAFGLVMAEMLLGRPLVDGKSEFDIFVAQGSDKPHELPDVILASPFGTVIERAIAKPLEVRYRLASQMFADVRAILERFGQGESGPGAADLEATRFFGAAPEPAAPNEAAAKLRKAFNAIADKAPRAAPPPAPPPPTPEVAVQASPQGASAQPTPARAQEGQRISNRPVGSTTAPMASTTMPMPQTPAPAALAAYAASAQPQGQVWQGGQTMTPSGAHPMSPQQALGVPAPAQPPSGPAPSSSALRNVMLVFALLGAVAVGVIAAYLLRNY